MYFSAVVLLLLAILLLASRAAQDSLQRRLHAQPALLFAAPAGLTACFCAMAAQVHALSLPLALLVAAYTAVPVVVAIAQRPAFLKRGSWPDLGVILLLWLPLEFAAGERFVPRPAQGYLHSVAYGIAILLGLVIFLGFRTMDGMKYSRPAGRDLLYAVIGFVLAAPVLIVLGRLLDFIPPFHLPQHLAAARMAGQFGVILAGTGLPEEILFRSLIQNWLMQRWGFNVRVLLLASFIFGCAHLDNGPQPPPNWRYMILATIAGVAYGKVFQKSSSVWGSAVLHALVDWTKHVFF